jgi:hypothetical protein
MSTGTAAPESAAGQGGTLQPTTLPLKLADYSGRTRRGRVIFLPERQGIEEYLNPAAGEEFRILILAEPTEGPLVPADSVVICAPARPLSGGGPPRSRDRKSARHAGLPLALNDLEALRQGRLLARTLLQVTAEEIFEGGRARLALLAKDLLVAQALADYLDAMAMALAAPGSPKPATSERLDELRGLLEACVGAQLGPDAAEAEAAITNVMQLTSTAGRQELLACAKRLYLNKQSLMEDIYLLRCLQQKPDEASELLAMRRFLSRAPVPAEWGEMPADRRLLTDELTFVALATEPLRFPLARAALERFRRRYVSAYRENHARHWAEMARIHAALIEEHAHADALRRINTLAELGPPMGTAALAAFEDLLAETAGCPSGTNVEEAAGVEGDCPACRLTLDQSPPTQRAQQVIARIERACDKQVTRLSSHIVHLIIRGRGDARLQQLLTMLQASQLSNLRDIMDDEVLSYLRAALSTQVSAPPAVEAAGAQRLPAADDLAGMVLREVLGRHGRAELHELLRKVAERMAAPYAVRVAGRPLAERVEETAAIILEQGCRVDSPRAEGDARYIDEYTCPFPEAARRNPAVCALHVRWVSILTGGDVRLTSSLLRNQPSCSFRIQERPAGGRRGGAPRHLPSRYSPRRG